MVKATITLMCPRLILLFALAISQNATADIVVMDFSSTNSDPMITHNIVVDGFRISPREGISIQDYGPESGWGYEGGSVAMGLWGGSGYENPDFLGQRCPYSLFNICVYIDRSGQLFSFLSFRRGGEAIVVESSKGGVLVLDPTFIIESLNLAGPLWEDIQWLRVHSVYDGPPSRFIDDLTFSVTPIADTDSDGVPDTSDNCTLLANPDQLDADSDGYGNDCDADLNNSGLTTATDFNLLRSCLNQASITSPLCAAADMNGSGLVTSTDFNLMRNRLNQSPGPSGLHP